MAEARGRRWPTGAHGSADAVLVVRDDGTTISLSSPPEHLSGGQPLPSVAAELLDLVHVEDRGAVVDGYRAWCAGRHAVVQCRLRTLAGWCQVEVSGAACDPGIDSSGIVVAVRDVTDLRRTEQLLEYSLDHDAVTGLATAHHFRADLVKGSTGSDQVVVVLDLDGLGLVNEQLGYLAGDRALAEAAARVVAAAPPGAAVARLGGDELAVAFRLPTGTVGSAAQRRGGRLVGPSTLGPIDQHRARSDLVLGGELRGGAIARTGSIDPEQVAWDLVEAVTDAVVEQGSSLRLGAVAGIAAGDCHVTGEQLLARADLALHQAKRSGSVPVVRFDEALDRQARRRRLLRSDLRGAVSRDELVVEYQPVMTVSDQRLVGFEALVRWEHPRLGRLGPDQFVALAEETGDIMAIGAWVLRRACAQLAAWSAALPDVAVGMAVNLSARQLVDPSFADSVAEIVEAAGLEPGALCLEVTESVVVHDLEQAIAALRALRATGVRIAFDDFGIGFSSLAYLRHFPADQLKVDRSFVAGLGREPTDTVLVESLVRLADRLGIVAIAEGVETAEQQAVLASMGCPLAQGYLWAAALPASAAGELLAQGDPSTGGWTTPWSAPGGSARSRGRGRGRVTDETMSEPVVSARSRHQGGASRGTTAWSDAGASPAVAATANDEVGSVMSYLAHEMRTPLHVIASFAEVARLAARDLRASDPAGGLAASSDPAALSDPAGASDPAASSDPAGAEVPGLVAAVEGIVRQVGRLEQMVTSLGDAKAVDRGTLVLERVAVDLADVVARVAGDLAGELGDHPLVVDSPTPAPVEVDVHRITQVLVNLVGNAVKCAPDGTPIDLVVTQDEQWVRVQVIDRGPGIPDELVADAFRRFASLDRRRRGTGLGLYLARGVARAHGGELHYRRAATGGAELELMLPRAPEPSPLLRSSARTSTPTSPETPTVPETPTSPETSAAPGVLPEALSEALPRRRSQLVSGTDVIDVVVRRDADALRAMVRAQHCLLEAVTVDEVVATVADLVTDLGGTVVSGAAASRAVADGRAIALDLSFGAGSPVLAVADPVSVARMRLEAVLPSIVVDATSVAHRIRGC